MALASLCLILFSGCAADGDRDNLFVQLRQGAAVEAFDVQALPALEAGLAEYWYPQALATVVIAVDRGQTDAVIRGWRDLDGAGEAVGFDDMAVGSHLFMVAMSYGLEGEAFTLGQAARLLASLRAKGLLVLNSFEAPIVICYDDQAAAMRQSGRDIEIVVPEEGTLTYVKGLLSNRPLELEGNIDLAAPYENASRVTDYGHLNAVCQDVTRVLRRSVFRIRLYSSADGREHQLFALLYMVLVALWTASVLRRGMQKGVQRAALLTGILLLGWITVRLLKYQLDFTTGLNRALWYGFYPFLLALPLVLLWLAWSIDQPEEKAKTPKWFLLLAAAEGSLVALVFTNDLHNWVFRLDLDSFNWGTDYGYGPGYYLLMGTGAVTAMGALAMMLVKGWRTPQKSRIAFPLALSALLAAYGAGFLLRVPLVWESDVTMVYGLFTVLFYEATIRAGMIPVNTKYRLLFTHSPLAMQILDQAGGVALSSTSGPLRRDEDTLLFTAPIAGGRTVWQEDIGALNRLHGEVEEYTRKLTVANTVLAGEERIRRAMEEENARTQLMRQLEAEIAAHVARLSAMIEAQPEDTARIALLLCYIKRRCNLFFRGLEARRLPASELAAYIDELAGLAGYAGVKILAASALEAPLDPRRATLFYDFFYHVSDWAARCACPYMLVHLEMEHGMVTMRLLPSEDARSFQPGEGLVSAIAAAGGSIAVKDLDGAVGLSLAFPQEGGEPYA